MRDFRRLFASRLLRTGLLFLFLVGAPSVGGAFRCCSTGDHDGGRRASAAAAGGHQPRDAHAAHAAHDAHAGHGVAPSAHSESKGPAEEGSAGAPCTCVGHCCVAPSIALGAQGIRLPDALQFRVAPVAIRDTGLQLDSRDAHLLPFGNGPPPSLAS
ncbi:MAG: hypothetical protein IT359_08910 [Gemmatimonadaceae bacterium]|nr:hypothetical protein [Gemmatimonadaceae bacterium]